MKVRSFFCLLLAAPYCSAASYERVYTIQMGAFLEPSAREVFIQKHRQLPLYCRKNSRAAYMVYYGVFQSYQDAKPHLQDIPKQAALGAYVVRLDKVRLKPCSNMRDRLLELG